MNAEAPGGHFVLGARTVSGNPYGGHTLAERLAQVARITGVHQLRLCRPRLPRTRRRQHPRRHRGITLTVRREIRRCSAIEPVIAHRKANGLLDRNFLAATEGDEIDLKPAAAGHNLRLLRGWILNLLAILLTALATAHQQPFR